MHIFLILILSKQLTTLLLHFLQLEKHLKYILLHLLHINSQQAQKFNINKSHLFLPTKSSHPANHHQYHQYL